MRLAALLALALAGVAGTAAAQEAYPNRAIRIVVPFPPGGGGDNVMRTWSDKLSEHLKVPIVVDNRGGGATIVGTDVVVNAKPDGYTLLLVNPNLATNPAMPQKPSYRTPEDFAPITLVYAYPMGLGAPAAFPPNNIQELIAYTRANPGKVNFGTSGNGSSSHLTGELLKAAAKIDIVHVPYKGSAQATNDLVGGHIQLVFTGMSQLTPHVKSGAIKVLGTSGKDRLKTTPDVPTVAEQGLTGFDSRVWWGLVAPAGTPRDIIMKLHTEVKKVLADPSLETRMAILDGEIVTSSSPEEFEGFIRSEIAKWGTLIKAANITGE